jgi:hypothetical protein
MPRFAAMIGGSGIVQSMLVDSERTVNWYVETSQSPTATSPRALYPTPGFQPWSQPLTDTIGRASCNAGGRIFFILGSTLFELNGDGSWSLRGTVLRDQNPAQLLYNGMIGGQIGIASGGNFYCYVLATNTLTLELPGLCTMAAYADGFFLALNSATGLVLLSALNDGTTWNLGGAFEAFFQRELFPDPWQTLFADSNNLIWLLGTETFEVWYNTGVGLQPWAPLSGLNGLYGIISPWAFVVTALGNFWLSANRQGAGQFVGTSGSIPQPILSYAFDTAVGTYFHAGQVVNAECMAYQQLGHTFVLIHFPSVPATWCYDVTEQSWAERGQWNPTTGLFGLWTPRVYQRAFGKDLVAGWTGNMLCDMNTAYTTEFDGATGIVRERTTPGLVDEHKRRPITQMELLMDVGMTPLQTGLGSNPLVTLRTSVDGGRTFGNERQASLGKIGAYRTRVYWQQLGAPADAVFRVRSSDPAPSRIVDAFINNLEA